MTWLKENIIHVLLIFGSVTFGYANFTSDIKANAQAIIEVDKRVDKYEEKIDKAIQLLERIDERTKKL
jgi:hypothetical protein